MNDQQQLITVLVATGLYPPDIGGPATYSRMLEERLHTHGIETLIIPFGTVRGLPKVIRHVAFLWKLLQQGSKIDVVYALDPISVGLPAFIASILMRKPFIVRLGGDYAWEQGQQRFGITQTLDEYTFSPQPRSVMVSVLAWLQSFVVRRAKVVVAPSEYLKRIIVTWGVDAAKIHVIYSALFPLEVQKDKQSIREQLSYQGTVISTVGRLVPWKGFAELIKVIKLLKQEIPDVSLVIIGDGPEEASLKALIEELHLNDTVRLVGKLGKEALGAALKGSDLFVLNTSYEGLSHQLLEVMELGIPIVTTNIGGNPELISDGVSGLLVPDHDPESLQKAIMRLLKNPDMQKRLVQSARVRTTAFSQEVVVGEFAELLLTKVVTVK